MDQAHVTVNLSPAQMPEIPTEALTRDLAGRWHQLATVVTVVLVTFQLYTATFGVFPTLLQRSVHVGLALVTCLLVYPATRRSPRATVPWHDVILCAAVVVPSGYVAIYHDEIIRSVGRSATALEVVLAGVLLLLVLETVRRTVGWIMSALALAVIGYTLFGNILPGFWASRGFSVRLVLEVLYLSGNGFWGDITGISTTIVAIFLIFGAILQYTGGGDSFVALARWIAGRSPGGPAKVSVVSSSLFGTISGSAVANVVVDGVFNIPLMKKTGYNPEFAAAVEATASTGGQIVPPIMGSAAFVMAQFLNIPYSEVATAAVLPAFLYYLSCWTGIHLEAKRGSLPPIPTEMIPARREVLNWNALAPLVIPVGVLMTMMSRGFTPETSAYAALWASIGTYFLPISRVPYRDRLANLGKAAVAGGRAIALVGVLIATAEVIVAMIGLSGVGVKFSEMLMRLGTGNLLLALVFSMMLTLVLGMGLPTTAAYVLGASVVVPSLLRVGVEPLSAHLFVFYFAVVAAITPPVCAAVWVAASIAQANWWRVGWRSVRLGLTGFMVPFFFAFDPTLLLKGWWPHVAFAVATAIVGTIALQIAMVGFLYRPVPIGIRLLIAALGILLIWPNLVAGVSGLAVFLLYVGYSYWRRPSAV